MIRSWTSALLTLTALAAPACRHAEPPPPPARVAYGPGHPVYMALLVAGTDPSDLRDARQLAKESDLTAEERRRFEEAFAARTQAEPGPPPPAEVQAAWRLEHQLLFPSAFLESPKRRCRQVLEDYRALLARDGALAAAPEHAVLIEDLERRCAGAQ